MVSWKAKTNFCHNAPNIAHRLHLSIDYFYKNNKNHQLRELSRCSTISQNESSNECLRICKGINIPSLQPTKKLKRKSESSHRATHFGGLQILQ